MPVDEELFKNQPQKESSQTVIRRFASDFSIKFIVIAHIQDNSIDVVDEWSPDMLKKSCVVIMKKGNFNLFKEMPKSKISEMVQVANLNF